MLRDQILIDALVQRGSCALTTAPRTGLINNSLHRRRWMHGCARCAHRASDRRLKQSRAARPRLQHNAAVAARGSRPCGQPGATIRRSKRAEGTPLTLPVHPAPREINQPAEHVSTDISLKGRGYLPEDHVV